MQVGKEKIIKLLITSFISLILLGGIFVYQQLKFIDGKLRVVFCNVGQGDGIYIRSPKGIDVVVDGGPDDSILQCLSSNMPFWDRNIEVMILSHPHEDHYLGQIDVIKRYNVLSFYTEKGENSSSSYKELRKALSNDGVKIRILSRGERLVFKDKTIIEILWPPNYSSDYFRNESLDANGLSLVQKVSYGRTDLLLTADSDFNKISLEQIKNIDIVEIPHHGSKNNIDADVFSGLNPKLAVISVGKNNKYGHPSKETLKILGDLEIKILRTDLNGEIELISDGNNWSINLD